MACAYSCRPPFSRAFCLPLSFNMAISSCRKKFYSIKCSPFGFYLPVSSYFVVFLVYLFPSSFFFIAVFPLHCILCFETVGQRKIIYAKWLEIRLNNCFAPHKSF